MVDELTCKNHTNDGPAFGALETGYGAWVAWAETMSKTHAQVRCQQCGKWAIWLPKDEAHIINAKAREEDRKTIAFAKRWDEARRKESRNG